MFVVNEEPHLLAKMPPPPADVKDLFKRNVEMGAVQFRATHYEYPTFPAMYCRLFIPFVKDFKPGQTKGAMVEALTIFTEANFQEWVGIVERIHTSKVIVYNDSGAVLAEGKLNLNTEAILFLVQEVDSANQCLNKIPESKRDFNAASNQFFKDHTEPFWEEPAKVSVPAVPKTNATPVVPPSPTPAKTPVFIGKRTNPAGTYEDYRGTDAESAKEFLLTKKTSLPKYYIRVETPEGNWGMDKEGLYLERLLPWQVNVTSAKVEGKHGFPGTMFGVIMAKKGIVDNFVVEIACGKCGHEWQDGVRYQNTTVVKCPKCKTLNKVDSTNITVF
jgi:phage FluMu protein Com